MLSGLEVTSSYQVLVAEVTQKFIEINIDSQLRPEHMTLLFSLIPGAIAYQHPSIGEEISVSLAMGVLFIL